METQVKKPDGVDEDALNEYLEYLDVLRESSIINMFGAVPYLLKEFSEIGNKELARIILNYWKDTFTDRHKGEK